MTTISLRPAFLPACMAGLLALFACGSNALAQSAQSAMTAQERAAAEIAQGWVAGWVAGDPDKVASYMEDDVLFSPSYPAILLERGKKRFLDENTPSIKRRGANKKVQTKVESILSIGGPLGTAVLLRRATSAMVDGKPISFSNAVFFWIVNGKIHTLYDIPLERPPTNVLNALAGEMQAPP